MSPTAIILLGGHCPLCLAPPSTVCLAPFFRSQTAKTQKAISLLGPNCNQSVELLSVRQLLGAAVISLLGPSHNQPACCTMLLFYLAISWSLPPPPTCLCDGVFLSLFTGSWVYRPIRLLSPSFSSSSRRGFF
jgi:hypothetical protein